MSCTDTNTATGGTSRWPARFALATWLCAIPLLLTGGTVTSLDAGMAIDGWWVVEPGRGDHFLLFYPIEKWFQDIGHFFEHSHRLFGVLVGNLAIAAVVATWMTTRRKASRRIALFALVIVCIQGYIGGSRVLESSPQLAFLHGALAQIVFAVLAYSAVALSPKHQRALPDESPEALSLARRATITIGITYVAIFAGAWLRHAYSHAALGVHVLFISVATVAIFRFSGKLKAFAQDKPERVSLRRAARNLHILVGVQLFLGVASFWIVGMIATERTPEVHQSAYPTSHVLFGAMILAQVVVARSWTRRSLNAEASPSTTQVSP